MSDRKVSEEELTQKLIHLQQDNQESMQKSMAQSMILFYRRIYEMGYEQALIDNNLKTDNK